MPNPEKSLPDNGVATLIPTELFTGDESLPVNRCLQLHRLMVRTRVMEERMIKMSKSGEGYFWIGGPGEEAFNACLGLQVKKGQGPHYDFLVLHYRNSATLVAMGMPLVDGIRQMAMTVTDPHSRGRNFAGHYARARVERAAGHIGHRSAAHCRAGLCAGAEAARRRRHHHRHRRRRGHGRGRFRFVHDLEYAAGQRGAGADRGAEQPLGHLDAGRRGPRREADHRPRQGVRHPRRGGGRQRSDRQLARRPPGDGLLPPRTPAVHAGSASSRGCTAIRHRVGRCVSRTSRIASHCSSKNCWTPACSIRRRLSRFTTRRKRKSRRHWSRRMREPKPTAEDVERYTLRPQSG